MSGLIADYCAKGAICHCLDEFSTGRGARTRVAKLRDELTALQSPFNGLSAVFDRHLLSHVMRDADERKRAVTHLEQHWFDVSASNAYFPGVPVASIYRDGVIKALDLALAVRRGVMQLNAWWLPLYPKVELVSLADVRDGATIGGRVTLLILTPAPQGSGTRPTDNPIQRPRSQGAGRRPSTRILGETAQAWWTELHDDGVRTIDIR